MALAERHPPSSRLSKSPGRSENALLGSLVCALLLFNVLVGVMVHRALPDEPDVQSAEVIVSHGD